MKKILTVVVAVIMVSSFNSYGQKGKELIFGAGGAITSVWIQNQNFYGEPEINYAPKMGYAITFNFGYNFTEKISAVAEFQYSAQGQKYDGKQNIGGIKYDTKRDINLQYFNIPVFAKYSFGTGNTKFRVMLGPQFSFLNSATQTYTRDGKVLGTEATNLNGKVFHTDTKNIKDRFINTDISIAFDLGADIYLSKKLFINAGFRVNYGFKDINDPAYRINDLDGEYSPSHNAWAGLYVGINYLLDVQGYSQRSF
jgi:hypothetical protein